MNDPAVRTQNPVGERKLNAVRIQEIVEVGLHPRTVIRMNKCCIVFEPTSEIFGRNAVHFVDIVRPFQPVTFNDVVPGSGRQQALRGPQPRGQLRKADIVGLQGMRMGDEVDLCIVQCRTVRHCRIGGTVLHDVRHVLYPQNEIDQLFVRPRYRRVGRDPVTLVFIGQTEFLHIKQVRFA